MKDKDQQLLAEAYQRVLENMEPNIKESPESIAIKDAATNPALRVNATNGIVGKHVTIYKPERVQGFENEKSLIKAEVKDGKILHSSSKVVGYTPIASGKVKNVIWPDANNDLRLELEGIPEPIVFLFFRHILVVH